MNRELENHLNRTQTLLQIWGAYARLSVPFSQRLQTLRGDVTALMNQPPGQDNTTQLVAAQIQAVHVSGIL